MNSHHNTRKSFQWASFFLSFFQFDSGQWWHWKILKYAVVTRSVRPSSSPNHWEEYSIEIRRITSLKFWFSTWIDWMFIDQFFHEVYSRVNRTFNFIDYFHLLKIRKSLLVQLWKKNLRLMTKSCINYRCNHDIIDVLHHLAVGNLNRRISFLSESRRRETKQGESLFLRFRESLQG